MGLGAVEQPPLGLVVGTSAGLADLAVEFFLVPGRRALGGVVLAEEVEGGGVVEGVAVGQHSGGAEEGVVALLAFNGLGERDKVLPCPGD